MKYLIPILFLVFGFAFGQINALKQKIESQDKCIEYVLAKDINLKGFYGEKIEFKNLYLHAQAAVALKYESCMWSK